MQIRVEARAARPKHARRLRVVDVALFYGARTGGIRTYLDAKTRYAARTGAFEHHVIVPGRHERHAGNRHELRSLSLAASNGYRLPLGSGSLKTTLRDIRPDAVLLHDPWWASVSVTRLAHELDAAVLAFHHACPAAGAIAARVDLLGLSERVSFPPVRERSRRARAHVRGGRLRRARSRRSGPGGSSFAAGAVRRG